MMREKIKILVVDDERDLVRLMEYNLRQEGYEVLSAGDGEEGLGLARETRPDLILLDLMLPRLPGMEVCRYLKQDSATRGIPIIMLTARGEVKSRVQGLESGADDYVSKPFHVRELLARIRAVLRRTRPLPGEEILRIGMLTIDFASHKVLWGERKISLSPREFSLLGYLARKRGHVCTRQQILDAIWESNAFVEPRTVDVHVRRLRSRIRGGDQARGLIRTVRGVGYTFGGAGE